MNGSRFDRAVAVLELVTGLGVAAYMIVLGVTAASGGVAFFVLAAVFLAILAAMSRGSWRRVRAREHEAREHEAREHDAREHDAREHDARVTTTPDGDVVVPTLSGAGRAELARVVAVLAGAGLFAPRVPDPADLEAAVADQGEPVDQGSVLAAVAEIGYWRPGRDPEEYLAPLAFHDSHVEQFADTLRAQIADLDRLAGDAAIVRAEDVEIAGERTRVRLRLSGDDVVLDYRGDMKYLSTEIHVAVARALRATPGAPRLAWSWVDQGVWISAVDDVAALNAELGAAAPDPWEWVDGTEPVDAGR